MSAASAYCETQTPKNLLTPADALAEIQTGNRLKGRVYLVTACTTCYTSSHAINIRMIYLLRGC